MLKNDDTVLSDSGSASDSDSTSSVIVIMSSVIILLYSVSVGDCVAASNFFIFNLMYRYFVGG